MNDHSSTVIFTANVADHFRTLHRSTVCSPDHGTSVRRECQICYRLETAVDTSTSTKPGGSLFHSTWPAVVRMHACIETTHYEGTLQSQVRKASSVPAHS